MFEPLLVRKYHLEKIKVKGDTIFLNNKPLCYVFGLSTAYNNKGGALFDKKTFKGANIIVDEIALEKGQRKTFDVAYNLKMQVENLVRSERDNVRVFFMLNNTEDCPDIMAMFNFIPLEFGVYKLKSKHCVIDYIPNNAAYEKRRSKALANEWAKYDININAIAPGYMATDNTQAIRDDEKRCGFATKFY